MILNSQLNRPQHFTRVAFSLDSMSLSEQVTLISFPLLSFLNIRISIKPRIGLVRSDPTHHKNTLAKDQTHNLLPLSSTLYQLNYLALFGMQYISTAITCSEPPTIAMPVDICPYCLPESHNSLEFAGAEPCMPLG